jgi:hypothetical protein
MAGRLPNRTPSDGVGSASILPRPSAARPKSSMAPPCKPWGSYRGGKMLFLGLGTGLGSSLIVDSMVEPLELGNSAAMARLTPVTMMTGAGMPASSSPVSSVRGYHLRRGPVAGLADLPPLAPLVRGTCSSYHVLPQQ